MKSLIEKVTGVGKCSHGHFLKLCVKSNCTEIIDMTIVHTEIQFFNRHCVNYVYLIFRD